MNGKQAVRGRLTFHSGRALALPAWLAYSAVVCLVYVGQMSDLALDRDVPWQLYFALTAGSALALICLVYIPLRLLFQRLKASGRQIWINGTAEGLLFMGNIAVSVGVRIFLIVQSRFRMEVYEQTAGRSAVQSGAATLDDWYLHGMKALTDLAEGVEVPAIGVQLLLQVSSLVFLYFACRMLAGRLTAILVMTGANVITVQQWNCGTEVFRVFAFCILLFWTALCIVRLRRGGYSILTWGNLLFCGLVCGIISWNDRSAATIFLLGVSAILMADVQISCVGRAVRHLLPFAGGCAAGFCCSLLWSMRQSLADYRYLLINWLTAGHAKMASFSDIYVQEGQLLFFLPLLALSFLYIFGFFDQPGRRGGIWFLPFTSLTAVNMMTKVPFGDQTVGLILWTVMAGMGLHSIMFAEGDFRMKLVSGKKKEKKKTEYPSWEIPSSSKRADADGMLAPAEAAGPVSSSLTLPGEPIDNPLPVPRKHIKKEIDFAFDPEPEFMHFDLNNLPDNDDFDIE